MQRVLVSLRPTTRSLVQSRGIHTSRHNNSLVATCFGVAGAAFGASKFLEYYQARKLAQAQSPEPEQPNAKEAPAGASTGGGWFTSLLSPGAFYQGGFEDTMTKREAALILGVRESASRDKIRDAHRYMSRVNHPDTGGSAYLATKINEARDLMLNSK